MKFLRLSFLAVMLTLVSAGPAHAQFSVNWKPSWDNAALKGYDYLGAWFFANGYQPSLAAGVNFAKNGYIGKDAGDADPFYLSAATKFTAKIVGEITAYVNLNRFGYYEKDNASNRTQVFSGPEGTSTPEKSADPGYDYGFYLKSGQNKVWYTDRFLNDGPQSGTPINAGGDPEALIYRLNAEEFLIAFEDLDNTGSSDNDFNDMWVKITVTPEPISSALFLLGAGTLGVSALRRRK